MSHRSDLPLGEEQVKAIDFEWNVSLKTRPVQCDNLLTSAMICEKKLVHTRDALIALFYQLVTHA
jgi:hypothetical protein